VFCLLKPGQQLQKQEKKKRYIHDRPIVNPEQFFKRP